MHEHTKHPITMLTDPDDNNTMPGVIDTRGHSTG
jgi:hypothetical protein